MTPPTDHGVGHKQHGRPPYGTQFAAEQIKEAETEELTAQKASLEKKKGEYRMEQLKAMEWKSLWMFPAIFAAGVLGIFLLLFRDKTGAEPEAKQV